MSDSKPFETVTHARLRAAQGDTSGAARVLRGILSRDPADGAALALLASIAEQRDAVTLPEDEAPSVEPCVPAAASDLVELFRASLEGREATRRPLVSERLLRWASRIDRNRGVRRVR